MLSEALRLMRVYHDRNQAGLADSLEISRSYLSEIENGKKAPNIEILERYAKEFSIPVSSILFFSEQLGKTEGPRDLTARHAIARKVLNFLSLLEDQTADDSQETKRTA